jgi:hypothetical protein
MFKRRVPKERRPSDIIYLKSTKGCSKVSILRQGDFSARLLELEIAIELHEFDMALLHELIDLYNNAIDYYMLSQSSNYLFFKNKLKGLFVKPRVINALKKNEHVKTMKEENHGKSMYLQSEPALNTDSWNDGGYQNNPANGNGDHDSQEMSRRKESMRAQKQVSIDNDYSPEKTLEFELKMQSFNMDKDVNTVHQKETIKQFLNHVSNNETQKEDILKASMTTQRDRFIEKLKERRNQKRGQSQNRSLGEHTRSDSISFDAMISFLKETDHMDNNLDLNKVLNNISIIKEEGDYLSPRQSTDKGADNTDFSIQEKFGLS